MANLLPLPGHLPANERCHVTFVTLYADETADPCQGNYQRIMGRLDPETNQLVTPLLLFEQAVGAGPIPQAYLCCALQHNQVRVYCLHLPTKYVGALDGQTCPWDGNSYAFLGEITQGVVTTHLDLIGNKGLPAVLADEPNAELVSTRRVMYLPARYVPLFLNPAGYTLRQSWDLLYPAIVTNNDLVVCSSLLKWLRVITMGTIVPNNPNDIGPTTAVVDLVPPLADQDLINHRQRILKQVLPSIYQPSQSLEIAITQMAVAVTQSATDSRAAHEEKAAR
jgi:hypothetical protein